MTRSLRIAIAGGSVGGLTAGCLLRDAGHEVTIYERSSRELEQRGAGIGLLEAASRYLLQRARVDLDEISISTSYIRYLDRSNRVAHEQPHRYRFSSWNTVYRRMLQAYGEGPYLLGYELTDWIRRDDGVCAKFTCGTAVEADLLLCADGVGSASRGRDGERRELSVPPGLVAAHHVDEARAHAAARLPADLAQVVLAVDEPFIQAVYDISIDRMAFGRICLLGDAAFVARPHAAAGTAKAAQDGWALAEALGSSRDLDSALWAWEASQLSLGSALVERARRIGRRSQVDNSWVPGDPQLLFRLSDSLGG